jgi:hypothetical protein
MSDIEGGCGCGAVRFKISEPLMGSGVCHCLDCQKFSGGGPNYVVLASKQGFAVTKGRDQVKVYRSKADSGGEVGRAFCAECGAPLYTETGAMIPFYPVKVGALDDASTYSPGVHLYMDSAQPWHLTHQGVPQFPKMPPMGPPPA